MDQWAILVAGGAGQRMGTALPKQFLPLAGKPILAHTIDLFLSFLNDSEKIRVVLPIEHFETWKAIAPPHLKNILLVKGGKNRYESVKNGLETIPNQGVVAIHDGVRPLVSAELVNSCFSIAASKGSAIPLIPLNDSIRFYEMESWISFDRDLLRAVQTPQTFLSEKIKKAYQEIQFSPDLSDDTMVYEKNGNIPYFIDGERENIKITTPADLFFAEAIMANKKRS